MARPARPLCPFSRAHIQARPILPHNPCVRKIFFVKYLHYPATPILAHPPHPSCPALFRPALTRTFPPLAIFSRLVGIHSQKPLFLCAWWNGPVYLARPRPDSGVNSSPSFLTGSIPAGGSVEKPGWRWAGDAPTQNGISCPRAVAVYPHPRPPSSLLIPISPPRSRRAGRRPLR